MEGEGRRLSHKPVGRLAVEAGLSWCLCQFCFEKRSRKTILKQSRLDGWVLRGVRAGSEARSEQNE